jgi:hypothetical protein
MPKASLYILKGLKGYFNKPIYDPVDVTQCQLRRSETIIDFGMLYINPEGMTWVCQMYVIPSGLLMGLASRLESFHPFGIIFQARLKSLASYTA